MKKILPYLSAALLASSPVAADSVSPGPGTIIDGPQVVITPQATCSAADSFVSRLTNPVSPATLAKYRYTICGLSASGVLAKLDALYLLQADTLANAEKNVISSSFSLTPHGTCFFGPLHGFDCDGSSGYYDTGFAPATAGGKFALNSASMFVGVLNNRDWVINTLAELGGSSASAFDKISPYDTTGVARVALSQTSSTTASYSGATSGLWVANRTASNAIALTHDGSSVVSGTTASSTLDTSDIMLSAGTTAGTTVSAFSSDEISVAGFGQSLTGSDLTNLQTYLAPWTVSPDGVPVAAAAWGFTTSVFYDSKFDSIDMSLTGNPGFKWYLQNFYTNTNTNPADISVGGGGVLLNSSSTNGNYRARIQTAGSLQATFQGSISGNTLTVTSINGGTIRPGQLLDGANVHGLGLTVHNYLSGGTTGKGGVGTYELSGSATVSSGPMAGNLSVGTTFSPGGFYKLCYAYDTTLSPSSNTYAIPVTGWLRSLTVLYGYNANATYATAATGVDINPGEMDPTTTAGVTSGPANSANDWTLTNGVETNFNINNPHSITYSIKPVYTNQHCYESLWVLTTQHSGTGLLYFLLDGAVLPGVQFSYSQAGGASPAFTPSNPNGTFYSGETQGNLVLMLQGSYQWPGTFSKTVVYH